MTQTVKDQNGTIHNFPDAATPEMIAEALGAQPPGVQPPANVRGFAAMSEDDQTAATNAQYEKEYQNTPDFLKPIMRGIIGVDKFAAPFNRWMDQVTGHATLGLQDEVSGLASGIHAATSEPDVSFGEGFDRGKAEEKFRQERYAEQHPTADKFAMGVGLLASGGEAALPTAGRLALPAAERIAAETATTATGKATIGSAFKQGAKAGAVQGGISGAASAEGDLGDRLEGGVKGAAEGAGAGGTLGALFTGAGRLASGDAVRRLFGSADAAANVSAMERAGMTPNMMTAGTSRTAAGAHKVAATAPLVDDWAADAATRTLQEGRQATQQAARNYGTNVTGREAGQTAQEGITQFIGEKPAYGSMSVDDARNIASQPTGASSFKEKETALYTLVENALPPMPRGRRFLMRDARETLSGLADPLPSNPGVSSAVRSPGMAELSAQINDRGGLSFNDMQRLRTRISEGLKDPEVFKGVGQQELLRLRGALTRDMDRAVASGGPEAQRLWRRANQYSEAGHSRFKVLETLTGAKTPEAVYSNLLAAAQGGSGKGNLELLQRARRSMTPEQWNEITAGLVSELGMPTAGAALTANRAGEFSPATFMTNLAKMSDQSRALVFGTGPQREAIDTLAQVFGNQKGMGRLANFSNSANQGGRMAWYTGTLMSGLTALPGVLTGWGGAAGLNRLMTSPGFARWIADGYRLAPNPEALTRHVARLAMIGKSLGWTAAQINAAQQAFTPKEKPGDQPRHFTVAPVGAQP